MRLNVMMRPATFTFEGAPALAPKNPLAELRRAVASCLLWEDQFYEDGVAIGDRIAALVAQLEADEVAALAVEARTKMKLRHAPLWLLAGLAKANKGANAAAYEAVIQRADEMGEIIAMHWKDGKKPLPAAMKRGIAKAFGKFDAYQLGKYNRKVAVSLKDVLRIVHPKPNGEDQATLWKRIVEGSLEAPDTWEVALSAGADKRETFERLIRDGKLGYLALLRNLRNMAEAGCDAALIRDAILARKGAHNVLPFRFIAAARAAPQFEPALDEALCAQIEALPVLPGTTAILVDVSGSMNDRLSGKSDLTRMDAAAALASIIPGNVRVFTFSNAIVEVPPRRGMAGVDAVIHSQSHGGTYLGTAVQAINAQVKYDRLIVVTDEQSHDPVGGPNGRGYMINVAAYRNGVGYGPWVRIDGFSENVLRFISEHEANVAR
jgi:hypothetical protein